MKHYINDVKYTFSFDLYLDGEFVTNVAIAENDRVGAWAELATRGYEYDCAKLIASRLN